MNAIDQRCEMALIEGWTRLQPFDCGCLASLEGFVPPNHDSGAATTSCVDDYLSDLNAVRRAEMAAGLHNRHDSKLRVRWINCIREVVSMPGEPKTSDVDLMNASATQRTKALLMTMGRWVIT